MESIPFLSRLREPKYGYVNERGEAKRPSLREIFSQLKETLRVFESPNHFLVALDLFYHLFTLVFFIIFLSQISLGSLLYFSLSGLIMGNIYNSIWLHRYCSHHAFHFKKKTYARLFLFTHPLVIREECYAVAHLSHHARSDKSGDPYGPHLGWFASYMAAQLTEIVNNDISEKEYDLLLKQLSHIGLNTNNYADFVRSGCVEKFSSNVLRLLVAQSFWIGISFLIGGSAFVVAWLAANFAIVFILREFNWRGHGGNFRWKKREGWEFYRNCRALNQYFYGYFASEWHDNHHIFPRSANTGFLSVQLDLAFQFIRLLKFIGLVEHYNNARVQFQTLLKAPDNQA